MIKRQVQPEISYNSFTQSLYNQVSSDYNQNVVVSPLSVFMSLLLCYAGAKGKTYQQIKQVLDLASLTDQQVFDSNRDFLQKTQIQIANKLYLNHNFDLKSSFVTLAQTYFKNNFEKLDFSSPGSLKLINDWITKQTNSKISQIVEQGSFNSNTKMLLVNSIYFKSNWMTIFDDKYTSLDDFYVSKTEMVKVPMMKIYNQNFKHLYKPAGVDADVIELPYVGGKIAMTILLPTREYDIKHVEKQLNVVNVKRILSLNLFEEPVNLAMPRFKIDTNLNMKDYLVKLGAGSLFDTSANFSGISDQGGLMVTDVIHKTSFNTNEDGTEAAAATSINFGVFSNNDVFYQRINYVCNKPFIFIVHEKNFNKILFMGKVVRP